MKKYVIIFAVAIFGIAFFIAAVGDDESNYDEMSYAYADEEQLQTSPKPASEEIILEQQTKPAPRSEQNGNGAGLEVPQITVQMPNQILKRLGYTVSYNNQTKCPNWVAWHLTKEHTDGPYPRKGVPYYDENGTAIGIGSVTNETQRGDYFLDLESVEPRQLLTDWNDKTYNMTHGHLCPAADNKWSKAAMNQSFLLTNMCPQAGSLNGGAWQKLEDKCRTWAIQYSDIYIVAGPIFNASNKRTMGAGKVTVPDAFFKVILCLTGTPKAIGFMYKNDGSSQNMKDAVCSVDEVESVTGMDFFFNLDDNIENEIEANGNYSVW